MGYEEQEETVWEMEDETLLDLEEKEKTAVVVDAVVVVGEAVMD